MFKYLFNLILTTLNPSDVSATTLLNLQPARPAGAGRRSREQLRQLWRLAIDQTVLLVRMEKENRKLRGELLV